MLVKQQQRCCGSQQQQWTGHHKSVRQSRGCPFVTKSADGEHATVGDTAPLHDGRLSLRQQLQQFVSPQKYIAAVLQGHKFAWGKANIPPHDAVFVADPATARSWMSSEWTLGIIPAWPPNISALLGPNTVTITQDPQLHARLRQLLNPYFTAEAIQYQMPAIHSKVKGHMAGWASEGSLGVYEAVRLLTFDILVNVSLGLNMSDPELRKYSQVYGEWVDGFMPPAIDLPFFPFGRGMAARRKLQERVRQALVDPRLPADGWVARLRDEFGADSDKAIDNIIQLLFAGHDTTSSAITFLVWQLSKHPEIVTKLRKEHQEVRAMHGNGLTSASLAAMPYTQAVIKETLRTAQVVPYVPRSAKKPLRSQSGEQVVPSGCPFIVAFSQMSIKDPAVSPDPEQFKPERWLDPKNAKNYALHQAPFGMGLHYCLGSQLAQAELTAILTEVARNYDIVAEVDTEWVDFPIKRPTNGLPCKVSALAGISVTAGSRLAAR